MVSAAQGARHLGLDHIGLPVHAELPHTATSAEEVFVLVDGSATVQANSERRPLARYGVVFLQQGDEFLLNTEAEQVTLLRCYSVDRPASTDP